MAADIKPLLGFRVNPTIVGIFRNTLGIEIHACPNGHAWITTWMAEHCPQCEIEAGTDLRRPDHVCRVGMTP